MKRAMRYRRRSWGSYPFVRVAIATLVALAISARPAVADDDGGTRSVFATGAGNRALAMGGAYGAFADDASAALWNPGGLGFVDQSQALFTQSDLSDVGFRETFAGFVLPDWRWGVASLTVRYFGTDGIEARDDRNVVVGENFGASETEIGLAYGRSFGAAWSVGGLVKLRRQQVAANSGGGLGADLGVQLLPALALGLDQPWARQLRMGLTLVNAAEPQIRLDRESVADPGGFRLGFGYEHPAFLLGGLIASFDLEKSRSTSLRPHAGIELRMHPMLAVRTGLDDGTLTAGTGLRWGRAALDYAFEDEPIGASHHVGLSYHFGSTVADAGAAAQRAEEERLERRLAELDRGRQSERLTTLLARAEEARQAGRYDDAVELLATLRTLDPGNANAQALEVRCLVEKARALEAQGDDASAVLAYRRALSEAPGDTAIAGQLERARASSDLKAARTTDLRRRFAAALDAFGADDLPAARSELVRLLAANPNDTEAQRLLRRVELTMSRRAEGWAQQATLLLQAGALREAEALIVRARALDPRAAGLAYAESLLKQKQQMAGAKPQRPTPAPQTTRPELTAQQQRELAEFYRRGRAALEAGHADEALRYWEMVWSIQPGYQRVDEYLKREYLTRGMERFAAGDLDEAVRLWEQALRIDPKDERTLGYLARAQEQRARAREIGGQE
jgi:tetratricopeptide (TPR) repeat protein